MNYKLISGQDFENNKENYQIIDVRTPMEFEAGHVEGAINIPYDEIIFDYDLVSKDMPVLLYCRTDNRSTYAARELVREGFDNIHVAPGVGLYDYKLVK